MLRPCVSLPELEAEVDGGYKQKLERTDFHCHLLIPGAEMTLNSIHPQTPTDPSEPHLRTPTSAFPLLN